jgi:hypothetical protein
MSFNNSYGDYNNSFSSAYITQPKVKIDFDSFALDLYRWMNANENVPKPQIEQYLVVSEAPSTKMAKSSHPNSKQ